MEYAKTNINNLSNDQVLDKIEELQQFFRRYKQKTEQLEYYKDKLLKGAEISDSVRDIQNDVNNMNPHLKENHEVLLFYNNELKRRETPPEKTSSSSSTSSISSFEDTLPYTTASVASSLSLLVARPEPQIKIVHKKPKTKVIKIEEPTEEKPIEAETEPNIATNRYYRPPSQKALRPSSMSEKYYRPPTQKALKPSPIEEPIGFTNIKYIKSLIKKHPELKDKIISSLMDEVVKGNLSKSDVEDISREFPVSTPQPFTYKTYQYAQTKTPLMAPHETNIYKQIPSANRIFIKN